MANTSQARKRARQAEKRRMHNASLRSKLRTHIKKVLYAIKDKNAELAETSFKVAVPVIDKMVSKGIIHSNKAARQKSRLNKHIKALKQA